MQWFKKASKASQEVPIELGRFIHKNYPDFVVESKPRALTDEVPVFMFHTIDRNVFRSQLEYLKDNHYQTLDLQTFWAFLKRDIKLDRPSVLLTFDDGEKSWYDVAYPLLKEYGLNAVGFVVPHYIRDEPQEKSHGKSWLSWPELIEMDRSGIIEIQSHSYYHARIFSSTQLVDFFYPDFSDALGLDVPWINIDDTYTNNLPLGTPIYQYAPRLVGKPRYFDPPELREACITWVQDQGGISFFQEPQWRKELTQYFYSVRAKLPSESLHTFEAYPQTREQIFKDLVQAKEVLSERLDKEVKHLCFPWGISSEKTVSLARELGYSSTFWVTLRQRRSNFPGGSPYFIPRLKDDYLFRLPGNGRHSLIEIFKRKLKRRKATLEIY